MNERMFPVLDGGHHAEYRRLGMPREVPWRLLAPHEEQAKRNHNQTLERLAERGGLGPVEMRAIVEGKRSSLRVKRRVQNWPKKGPTPPFARIAGIRRIRRPVKRRIRSPPPGPI